jgi:hypothetical protein
MLPKNSDSFFLSEEKETVGNHGGVVGPKQEQNPIPRDSRISISSNAISYIY